jgi:predicted 2-oxoglutarate/Fe(II)-dependent dioxygenase YbiX
MPKVNIYHGRIYEVEGFISLQEVEPLLVSIASAPESSWFDEDFPDHWNGKTFPIYRTDDEEIKNTLRALDEKVLTYLVNPGPAVQISDIHRFRKGDTMGAHVDNAGDDFKNVFGAIIYLNEDFEGGELYYPELDFRIKPKANSLVMHDASLLHQVLEVTEGIRYTLTTFIQGDGTTKFLGGQDAI